MNNANLCMSRRGYALKFSLENSSTWEEERDFRFQYQTQKYMYLLIEKQWQIFPEENFKRTT